MMSGTVSPWPKDSWEAYEDRCEAGLLNCVALHCIALHRLSVCRYSIDRLSYLVASYMNADTGRKGGEGKGSSLIVTDHRCQEIELGEIGVET